VFVSRELIVEGRRGGDRSNILKPRYEAQNRLHAVKRHSFAIETPSISRLIHLYFPKTQSSLDEITGLDTFKKRSSTGFGDVDEFMAQATTAYHAIDHQHAVVTMLSHRKAG
jgi:hypothetical protein